jgi:2-polyprenyl-3-methyl-5-hydroxy-6-metoxy-1,4-benzoquinol methylase
MGQPQTWDPERYARNARFVAELGAPVVDLLAPRAGERILDLGCGDGMLTAKLGSMGRHVIGVDASAPQIDAARKLDLDVCVMKGEARH